mmetsp:Transcript_56583/g.132751  ORF Transcript_56583/g.132751 Transcript_56583/m.132751 type:complete len:613 (+) Transcript_56583:73-1911(+)
MWRQLSANLSCRPCGCSRQQHTEAEEDRASADVLEVTHVDEDEDEASGIASADKAGQAVLQATQMHGAQSKDSSAFHSADTRSSGKAESPTEPRRSRDDTSTSEGGTTEQASAPAFGSATGRRVYVENVFEFYDTTQRRKRVHRMTAGDHLSAADFMSMVSTSSASTSSNFQSDSSNERPDPPVSVKLSEVEILTDWTVLVGKLLHAKVLGMDDLAFRHLLQKKRSKQAAKIQRFELRVSVQQRARTVVEKAKVLAKALANEPVDRYDAEWADDRLLAYLFSHEYIDTFLILASTTRRVLASEPIVARAQAPCRVFGDIHGQLRDLLLLLHIYGLPSDGKGPTLVFNGDFVDRGAHQVEVLGLLFALKLAMPGRIVLVRGNHEDRVMNERYGFQEACRLSIGEQWGKNCYDHFHKAFDQMPLACVIEENILVVHGGIGDGRWTIADLEMVRRPIGVEEFGKPGNAWLTNILWSDPILDNKSFQVGMYGVHPSPRRTGEQQVVEFGWNVTKGFCARNGLSLVIRSHQSRVGSLGFDVMHDDMLLRVFSARDYEDHENDGAVLLIRPGPEGSGALVVRPQVLGSVSKARKQAYRVPIGAIAATNLPESEELPAA